MHGKDFIDRYESFTFAQLCMRAFRSTLMWFVTLGLGGLLALGLSQTAVGLFYALVNLLNRESNGSLPLFLGLKCTAVAILAIWIISLYPNQKNQLVCRRSLKLGVYLGALLLVVASIDAWVVHYYSTGFRCELPLPGVR